MQGLLTVWKYFMLARVAKVTQLSPAVAAFSA
jgi:hypothetical protein